MADLLDAAGTYRLLQALVVRMDRLPSFNFWPERAI